MIDNYEQLNLFGQRKGECVKEFDGKYTEEVKIPHYQPQGLDAELDQLCNAERTDALIEEILASGVSEPEKEFLIRASHRFDVFNFKMIAEYYAQASEEMKYLMEKNGLVIIDINNAIANGYFRLNERLRKLMEDE